MGRRAQMQAELLVVIAISCTAILMSAAITTNQARDYDQYKQESQAGVLSREVCDALYAVAALGNGGSANVTLPEQASVRVSDKSVTDEAVTVSYGNCTVGSCSVESCQRPRNDLNTTAATWATAGTTRHLALTNIGGVIHVAG